MSFYLLEIGSEEIPAGFIPKACNFLKQEFTKRLNDANIQYSDIISDGTPRRFFVYISGLAEKQADTEELIMGPPASIAFDADGSLTKAGAGFAKSKGLDEKDLQKIDKGKGEYLAGLKKSKGIETFKVFEEMVPQIIQSIPFQKSMRWGDKDFKYARPVHWFLSLFDDQVLNFEIDGIKSGDTTFGHRIMSPEKIKITDFEQYKKSLSDAYVDIDTDSRKKAIMSQIDEISTQKNCSVVVDTELLDTVAGLVEYPVSIAGEFEKEYLELPPEVLVTSMKYHQKYFHVEDKNGQIMNMFVGVSNTEPNDRSVVQTGYERVLRARLNDGQFFYNNDKNVKLETMVESLKKVVYQEKLGTSYEKMQRFSELSQYIADKVAPSHKDTAQRTAFLCKADLMSEMVYEFPELQGIMGREYAKLQGEDDAVVRGIYEHYLPRFAGDELPETHEGAIVSLADKLDTMCGCFAIGLIPSGNTDPYALRRGAIGIIQIINQKEYRLDIGELINRSLDILQGKTTSDKDDTARQVKEFIFGRLKHILSEDGVQADAFEAVSHNFNDILGLQKCAKALSGYRNSEEFAVISAGYKRINNIIRKNDVKAAGFDPALFETDEERTLGELIGKKAAVITELTDKENFDQAMKELLTFSEPVNGFFDAVMVMAEDEKVRNNRFGLLNSLKEVFDKLGDLSKIV